MIGTCVSSSLITSPINSAASPVSFFDPCCAWAFLEVIRVRVGTATAEMPAARVRKERREGAGWASSARLVKLVSLLIVSQPLGERADPGRTPIPLDGL